MLDERSQRTSEAQHIYKRKSLNFQELEKPKETHIRVNSQTDRYGSNDLECDVESKNFRTTINI